MHQSGQLRAHSMQTVQFSSFNAMTPRARVGGASLTRGYCTVTARLVIVRKVTPRPFSRPVGIQSGAEGIAQNTTFKTAVAMRLTRDKGKGKSKAQH